MLSQNVVFEGESIGDDPHHSPGEGIICLIAEFLNEKGYSPTAIDNWRDCGWSIELEIDTTELQISVARTSLPNSWIAQVACLDQPGPLRRLFGAKLRDCNSELFEIALAVHRALSEAGLTKIRWCIDGYPDGSNSSPEPRER
jgi:hypothetical protein